MASPSALFESLSLGTHAVQASLLGWRTVGSCEITQNSPSGFSASGNYNALGQSGTFDLTMTLTGQDPAARSGPCTIVNAGQSLEGTYVRDGWTITFTVAGQTVSASPERDGVVLQMSGLPKFRISVA